ncbi:MAG: type II toxin-antitoxin system RelE/ParE family toxin [Gemmatimonadetes bacterium]|nr:type II toxin-antitoxin system RelE/ParE family toxin [Gemmatimonadota bacterium]
MTPTSVVLREAARRDVNDAVDHYLTGAGRKTALRFIDRVEEVFRHVAMSVETGSPRHGHELNLPGLRTWPVRSFPYLVCYMTARGQVDVWRVVHRADPRGQDR